MDGVFLACSAFYNWDSLPLDNADNNVEAVACKLRLKNTMLIIIALPIVTLPIFNQCANLSKVWSLIIPMLQYGLEETLTYQTLTGQQIHQLSIVIL